MLEREVGGPKKLKWSQITSEVEELIGVECHGSTPIVGRTLGTELGACGGPKAAKMEPSRGPKEAPMQPKSILGPSGEVVFCLTWRLEGC